MKTAIKALAASSAFMFAMNASADGRIEGRISDAQGKVYFDGAIVRLKELKLESSSKDGGRFHFNAVPAGTYTLVIDYLGAESVQRLVNVVDDKVAKEVVKIGDDISAMENVIVVGQAAGASSALNKQRSADNFVSVVSADSIGQFPDENVSEALQRVPGVFIERDQGEGRFVGIRGVDPNLNSSSINGVAIPAPERDRRSVALDVIPSGLLEGLEVTKTVTPDMDGSTIGGNIEVKSLSAFDRDGMSYKISGEANYNDLEEEVSPKFAGSFTNVFDVGAGQVGVAAALSWQDRDFGSEVIEGDGEWETFTHIGTDFRAPATLEQRDYTINRERLGAAFNIDWRPNDTSEYYLRTLYSHFEDQEYRQRTKYKFDKGDIVDMNANSASWDDAELVRDFKDRYEEQKITSVVLGGMNMNGDWTYEYSLGYSKSSEKEPGRRDTEFEQEDVDIGYTSLGESPNLVAEAKAFDPGLYELKEIVLEDNFTEDEIFTYKFDVTREMYFGEYPGYVKVGGKLTRREKTDDVESTIYDDFGALGDPMMTAFVAGQVDYGIGLFGPRLSESAIDRFIDANVINSGTTLQDDGVVGKAYHESLVASARDYTINEDVDAVYLMSRVDIDDLRLVYGVRYESTDFSAKGFNAKLIEEASGDYNSDIEAVKFDSDYDHWLPSINARYRLNDQLIIRAAYSETIARPSFGDLNPSPEKIEIEGDELTVEAGNPLLKPYESSNFDLAVEYYPGDIGIISAGIFYKKIDNFIFSADVSDVTDSADFAPGVTINDMDITKPLNGESADLYGLELTYTKNFESGFLIQANATLTSSEADLGLPADADRGSKIDLPEQADTTGNLVFGYETGALSLRLSAAYKSERLIEVDLGDKQNDLFQDAHMQVDFSAKYDVNQSMQVYFNAINLNDEPYYRYHGNARANAQYEEYGPSFVLGLTYRNF